MSLKDRLAGKAVRTLVVQIPVGDPPPDLRRRAWEEAERAEMAVLSAGMKDGPITDEAAEVFTETAQATLDELGEFYEDLHLHAVGPAEWDRLVTEFTNADGDLDGYKALPEMLAVSCVDEDLQDAEWWGTQLAGAGWTFGDREALLAAVMRLNAYLPKPQLGKGSRTTRS